MAPNAAAPSAADEQRPTAGLATHPGPAVLPPSGVLEVPPPGALPRNWQQVALLLFAFAGLARQLPHAQSEDAALPWPLTSLWPDRLTTQR